MQLQRKELLLERAVACGDTEEGTNSWRMEGMEAQKHPVLTQNFTTCNAVAHSHAHL